MRFRISFATAAIAAVVLASPADAATPFRQSHRIISLTMQFGTDSFAPNNRFGAAVVGGAMRSELQASINSNIASGFVSQLLDMPGLSDLSGMNVPSLSLGAVNGSPGFVSGNPTTYSGTSDLDWWYLPAAEEIDSNGNPTSVIGGSIAAGALQAGPGTFMFAKGVMGTPQALRMSGAYIAATVGSSSAPLQSSNNFPPGHLPSEGISGTPTFATMSGGKLRGNISAASLAAIPIPASMTGGGLGSCSQNYTAANTWLDVMISGCTVTFVGTMIAPTQPDQVDPGMPAAGAGGPYVLSANPTTRSVTTCRDSSNAVVPLATCLGAAAYSAYYTFTTDRVILTRGAYDLTVTVEEATGGSVGGGGFNCADSCVQRFMHGESMQLVAAPAPGFRVAQWYGCDTVEGNTCSVYMDAARTVTVAFVAAASNDFNADGKPDIIWSNTANGATYVWHMNGPALISDAFIAQIDPSWKVQGVADFNGDGKPDLVWRNTANGNTYVWYMNGATFVTDAFLFGLPPEWVIQGVADFNADDKPDFLMRNVNSGVGFAWFFNDNVAIGDQFLFGIDPAWKVEQVGDVNADGQPDLLFRNMGSGLAFAWYTQYSGGNLSLGGSTPPIFSIDPVWEIVQLDDWNGDASPDLLFRNASSGVVFVWYMTGTTLGASDFVIQIDPSWEIVPRR